MRENCLIYAYLFGFMTLLQPLCAMEHTAEANATPSVVQKPAPPGVAYGSTVVTRSLKLVVELIRTGFGVDDEGISEFRSRFLCIDKTRARSSRKEFQGKLKPE